MTHPSTPPLAKRSDDTHAVTPSGDKRPKLPHEHDESNETQAPPAQQDIGRRAFEDARGPQQDTGRMPVVEEVGRRLKSSDGQG